MHELSQPIAMPSDPRSASASMASQLMFVCKCIEVLRSLRVLCVRQIHQHVFFCARNSPTFSTHKHVDKDMYGMVRGQIVEVANVTYRTSRRTDVETFFK